MNTNDYITVPHIEDFKPTSHNRLVNSDINSSYLHTQVNLPLNSWNNSASVNDVTPSGLESHARFLHSKALTPTVPSDTGLPVNGITSPGHDSDISPVLAAEFELLPPIPAATGNHGNLASQAPTALPVNTIQPALSVPTVLPADMPPQQHTGASHSGRSVLREPPATGPGSSPGDPASVPGARYTGHSVLREPPATGPGSSPGDPVSAPPKTPHCFYGQVPHCSPVPSNWPRINPTIWSQELSPLTQQCLRIYDVVRDTALPNFMSARIPIPSALNIPAWRELIQEINYPDHLISDFLEFGFPLDYQGDFYTNSEEVSNHQSALQFPDAISAFVETELTAKAVIGPFNDPCFHPPPKISPLMTRPKHDSSSRRVIMDLSWGDHSVNSHIDNSQYLGTPYKLALPTVDTITDMILSAGQGCWIYKRDLSRAYKQLRTCPLAWPLTAFQHEGKVFLDTSIVFGARPGAMFCQRTTDVLSYTMHHFGYNMRSYLDDMLGVEKTQEQAQKADSFLGQKLDDLGLDHKEEKHCQPAQSQVCLGILFDSVNMTKSIPPSKLHEVGEELATWSNKQFATKRQLQSLAGKLLFIAKCSSPARLFINSILADLRAAPDSGTILLSETTRSDIHWFQALFPHYNGLSLLCHPPLTSTQQVDCDSCLSGIGAKFGDLYYSEQLPQCVLQLQLPITHLEMFNLLIATRLFAPQWAHHTVTLGCDNAASVSVLQTGRSRDRFLASCAIQMWFLATIHDVTLTPVHRSGDTMQQLGVDALSRGHLSPRFQHIIQKLLPNATRIRVPPALFALPPL